MSKLKSNLIIWPILIVIFISFFLLSIPQFSGDVKNHVFWGGSILNEGPAGFYGRDMQGWSYPNYPPVSMLSFAGAVWLYNSTKDLFFNLNNLSIFPSNLIPWIEYENVYISFLKIPAILPFVLSGYIIFLFGRLFKKSFKQSLIYMLVFLLNPAFFYLAVVWGQNDFSQVVFALGAFYLLLKEKYIWSAIFITLSILSKQTALMVWGIFFVSLFKLKGIGKSTVALLVSATVLWLSYLPFNVTGPLWPFTYYAETLKSTGFLVADNAINFWGFYSNFKSIDAGEIFFYLKYEQWGFIIFAITFLPLLFKFLKIKFSPQLLFYFLFLSSITYFFILTRMHERYLFFGVVFAQLLLMTNKKFWYNLAFFTLLFFINLYRGLYLPDFPILHELFQNNLFLNTLVLGYFALIVYNYYYFMFKLKNHEKN